jgi:hypothetical protein
MRNEDLHEVEPLIRDNLTPVVVVERLSWPQLEGRVQACRLADGLDVKTLAGATAIFPPTAGLRKGNESPTVGAPDAETLARLEKSLYGKIKVKTKGLAIYGHRGQWVVVVDQALNKGKNATMNVSRRLYLTGQEPQDARMLQSYWVLADKSAWHRIKSWAPPVMVASQKKVAVAQPKKVKTSASPPPAPKPQTAGKNKSPRGEVVDTLQDWIKAWSGKHLEAYLSFYAPEFKTDKMDIKAWGKQKAYLNQVYKKITVKADKVKVDIKGDRAKVAFRQYYRSDWHKDVGYKQLELVKRNGRWLIVSETWRPIDSSEAG